MIVINKSVFCRNLDGARLLGHPVYGDFNYDLLQVENKYTSKFIDTMFDHCFYSMVNKPTRITNSSATVLDRVWTNIYSYIIKAKILLHPISDHLPLITCFEAYQHKNIHNSKIRIFNPENINNFHNTLDSTFDIDVVLTLFGPGGGGVDSTHSKLKLL